MEVTKKTNLLQFEHWIDLFYWKKKFTFRTICPKYFTEKKEWLDLDFQRATTYNTLQ